MSIDMVIENSELKSVARKWICYSELKELY